VNIYQQNRYVAARAAQMNPRLAFRLTLLSNLALITDVFLGGIMVGERRMNSLSKQIEESQNQTRQCFDQRKETVSQAYRCLDINKNLVHTIDIYKEICLPSSK
jgi:hypothetical protein